jgi:hypothetical protein
MNDDERITHNSLLKSDLLAAGFVVDWTFDDKLIVSLNRRLSVYEVRNALDNLEYDRLYTAKQYGPVVWVDAVS